MDAGSRSSIIDNRDDNTLLHALGTMGAGGRSLDIATAFFSLDALLLLADSLVGYERVRILFGDDANAVQRKRLLDLLRERSDVDLLKQRLSHPTLDPLRRVAALFAEGRIEARCYSARKFHAKSYLIDRAETYPPQLGVIGSGNFTRPGLTQNVELNVELSKEQVSDLAHWFEDRWQEAQADVVTDDLIAEIKRQIDLYDPFVIFQKALLLWGDWIQGREALPQIDMLRVLDPHQEDAYRQALKIIDRERGVLICDGVGLGKSFVALALMEHYLKRGKRVFLIAPKAIMSASWDGYLRAFLDRYRRGYNSLAVEPMTWFGWDPARDDTATRDKVAELIEYAEQAELVIIDESHNFRKTDSNRYVNLLKMLQDSPLGPKTVVLLTATPINTEYQDLAAQFRLITQERGHIGGIRIEQYQRSAVALDGSRDAHNGGQLELDLEPGLTPQGLLRSGLEAVAIQRSRTTCKRIAEAKGRRLRFPEREPIRTIKYDLSEPYRYVVKYAEEQFSELARFLKAYRAEVSRASRKEEEDKRLKVKLPTRGLRFSAYLPDRYRRAPGESLREAQVESFLVSLVFVNVMKQLESSPEAFRGILRALGAGLCARLTHMARRGDLDRDQIAAVVAEHAAWISGESRADDDDQQEDDPVAADASGDEMDEWLERALRVNNVRKGLADFSATTHEVATWRKHIEGDLSILQSIYERTQQAWESNTDQKLEDITSAICEQRGMRRKVLIFTQSRRTAEYLEKRLRSVFPDEVARIDTTIQGDRRARILNAFSPRYNPIDQQELQLTELNILVSTDVLSEGVNLQEAGCILNYDIHWNPVRLIQRIGRVDRRLRDDDPGHTFAILNVEPPPEIEKIIELVGTVENRQRKICSMLGLDQSFFRADDPEGTLQEFNAQLDGEITARDAALAAYDALIAQNPADAELAQAVPAGAFGVWSRAPVNGLFAAFTMTADPARITDADRERFRAVIDMPVLAIETDGRLILEPAEVLSILAGTRRGEPAGHPGDPEMLKQALQRLRDAARQSFAEMGLSSQVKPELVCWMQLRSGGDATR